MKSSVAFVAAVAAVISTSAVAADLPVKAAPLFSPVSAYNWTGFYLGAHVGHLSGTSENDAAGRPNGSASTWFVGVQGGYRYQFPNNFVLGVQVAVPVWGENQTFNATPFGGGIVTVKYKGSVLVQGILGYAINRFLPYATLGVGAARIQGQEVFGAVAAPAVTNTHTLVTAGLGLKYAVTQNWQVGVGYNHIWSSSQPYSCAPVCGIPPANFKMAADSITGSIDYRF